MGLGRSVLFVCANEEHREAYASGLRLAGWLPFFVPSTERALSCLTQFRVAAIVLSMNVDSADAWERCANLCATDTPIVVLRPSTRRHASAAALAAMARCGALVAQPCTPGDLSAIVERVAGGEFGIGWPTPVTLTA